MHRKQLETGSPIGRVKALALSPDSKLELRAVQQMLGPGPLHEVSDFIYWLGPYMGGCVVWGCVCVSFSYDSIVQPGTRLKRDTGQGENNDFGRKKGEG